VHCAADEEADEHRHKKSKKNKREKKDKHDEEKQLLKAAKKFLKQSAQAVLCYGHMSLPLSMC
jgi:hypothetical protein